MHRLVSLFCVLLAVSGSLEANTGPKDYSRPYVDLAPESQFKFAFHKIIRDALLKIDVPYKDPDTDSDTDTDADSDSGPKIDFVKLKTNLKAAMDDEKANPTHRQVYKDVLEITSLKDHCPKPFVKVYLSIWAQSVQQPKVLAPFFKFMQNSAPRKFQSCSERVNKEFKNRPIELRGANDLDKVMFNLFDIKLEDLHDRLKVFSMISSPFDATRMEELAKQVSPNSKESGYKFLETFWLSKCDEFNEDPLPRMLDVLGLARQSLTDFKGYDSRLLRMSEYRRLCFEWKNRFAPENPKLNRVKANIDRQTGKI